MKTMAHTKSIKIRVVSNLSFCWQSLTRAGELLIQARRHPDFLGRMPRFAFSLGSHCSAFACACERDERFQLMS
jgi:hypothetical protein